ncbi:MarR family winged helix-turn-helix transcriptional regulator [Paenibacillus sp. sgz500958]|uniref:MarR family winged helix-turn-helix transcriptional regulator n=1 Tax=Paenibacillus sp. sgz500958 TaxID=3242475 RepID=UPI0036D284D8
MDAQYSQEKKLLIALENIKRLTSRAQNLDSVPHGEFVMMFVIQAMMKKEQTENAESCPGIMISKLSDLLQISRPTASQMISSLEEKGYILREMSRSDRRVIYIRLTGKGDKVFETLMTRYLGILNEIIERVGREEIDQLIHLCDRFQNAVNEVRPKLMSQLSMEEFPAMESL